LLLCVHYTNIIFKFQHLFAKYFISFASLNIATNLKDVFWQNTQLKSREKPKNLEIDILFAKKCK